jgi:hypothetical protein
MFGAHITVKSLFLLIFCWMASSSNAIPENAVLSPKAKVQVFVTLIDIRVEKSRCVDMYCIRGFREDKRKCPPKTSIATKFVYGTEAEAKADEALFKWYHGHNATVVGQPPKPALWNRDWVCKPRESPEWTNIIAFLEGGGTLQSSPNPNRLKRSSDTDISSKRNRSYFSIPGFDELNYEDKESDSDYDSETDDEIVVPAPISKALKKKYCDLGPRSKKLFGAFLRDNVGELMPFDSKAEVNHAVNAIFMPSGSAEDLSDQFRISLLAAWNAKQYPHFNMLATILRGAGMTRSHIETYLGVRIGKRRMTAIGFHLAKYLACQDIDRNKSSLAMHAAYINFMITRATGVVSSVLVSASSSSWPSPTSSGPAESLQP